MVENGRLRASLPIEGVGLTAARIDRTLRTRPQTDASRGMKDVNGEKHLNTNCTGDPNKTVEQLRPSKYSV